MSYSWKEQMLLNIVRIRYADAPVFIDVSSIISSYGIQTQAQASGGISVDEPGSVVGLGATASYLDKPTITYTPLTGERFTRSLLKPIPPATVFSLIEAGYPADFVLAVTVTTLNGISNRSSGGARSREMSPEWIPLIEAMRRLQLGGALGMRLEKRAGGESALIFFPREPRPDDKKDIDFVKQTLKLKPDGNEILISFGVTPTSSKELALLTRSMLEILIEVSAGIEVPVEHIAKGSTTPDLPTKPNASRFEQPIIRIRSGSEAPADAFVAGLYRNTWYWIDDGDLVGKRAFTSLMMFMSLAETGASPQPPVITIPAN
jgi:hypothetical protein